MKNYSKFDEIQHTPLRVFNRVVLMTNLLQDFGKEAMENYAASFTEGERKQMFIMQEYIKVNGEKEMRQMVTNGLSLVPEKALEDV